MRRLLKFVIWLLVLGLLSIAFSNFLIISKTKARVESDIKELSEAKVALVLGTSKYSGRGGGQNYFFSDRMKAAAQLYELGKVKHIIASGDNRSEFYNEPKDMLLALKELGVPESAITLDYAGLRTFDSIVRCKEVFGQNDVIIVTQRFHSYRALFIADHFGLNGQVYAANFESHAYSALRVREVLARVLAIADLYFLDKQPKFLGDKEELEID